MNFPKDFYWGSASSALQTESNLDNDWTDWIKASRINWAATARERLINYSKFAGITPTARFIQLASDLDNYNIEVSSDHQNHYQEDYDLAAQIGVNAHRLSIEWSRIEPEPGLYDQKAIEQYIAEIDYLISKGIEPCVTLWHFSSPKWFAAKGGWLHKDSPLHFLEYLKRIVPLLKDKVKFYITVNEPLIYASNTYVIGTFPPEHNNLLEFYGCLSHIMKAHRLAYTYIKTINPDTMVGFANYAIHFETAERNVLNEFIRTASDWWVNKRLFRSVLNYQDYIGVNYYSRNVINWGFNKNDYTNARISDLGLELHPEGMYHILSKLKDFNKPIFILENGLADESDQNRSWYLAEVVKNIGQAIDEGADVRGYFYWSLTDNFEIDNGRWPRFGLIEIDYKTQKRILRPSAQFYKQIIESNGNLQSAVQTS